MECIEQFMREFIARTASAPGADFHEYASSSVRALETAALTMVSEVAAGVRNAEERAAEMLVYAENLVNAAIGKIQLAEACADRAEAARLKAEAEAAKCATAAAEARRQAEQAQTMLVTREAELAVAEQRANSAEAAVQRIMDAIRTQLPVTSAAAVDKASIA